ncbi:hypothetical protein [Singulisphaera sp. PoT]|uniref:hypothetical protein n=1 Tax=Singulisphaera sp. PoT TaxID=3411797 RepID=UPI003BF532A6
MFPKELPTDPSARAALLAEAQKYLDYFLPLLRDLEEIWDDLPDSEKTSEEETRKIVKGNYRLQVLGRRIGDLTDQGPPTTPLLEGYVDLPEGSAWEEGRYAEAYKTYPKCCTHYNMTATVEQTVRVCELFTRLSLSPPDQSEREEILKVDISAETVTWKGVTRRVSLEGCCFLAALASRPPGTIVSFGTIRKEYPVIGSTNQSRLKKKIESDFPGLVQSHGKLGYYLAEPKGGKP